MGSGAAGGDRRLARGGAAPGALDYRRLEELDLICARFTAADTIILVDHPLRVHLWWALKRQALSVVQPQPGGPSGCPLLPVTGRMLQVIWRVHRLYRPELLALIAEMEGSKRIIRIRSPREMQRFTQRITTRS